MTYTRIASALFAAMIPFSALAADVSAGDVVGSVLTEVRPESLYLKTMKQSQGRTMTVVVTGAREGGMAGKMWTKTSVDWKSGSEWMKVQAEMRLKSGKAFLRINTASSSAGVPAGDEFRAAAGTWYELDLNDPAVKDWFMSGTDASMFGSLFSLNRTRYQAGYSNALTLIGGSSALSSALEAALPPLLVPDALATVTTKIDTNGLGAFQYASMKGDTFEARMQRTFGAVYVETPKMTKPLPRGEVAAMFFSPTSGGEPMQAVQAPMSSSASSAPAVMHVQSVTTKVMTVSSSKHAAERAIIDLVGPNGTNLKRTVRLATTQTPWPTLAAFRFDFGRDGGVLYTYPNPIKPVFTTNDAYEPLDVIFFDENGGYISSARMPKCTGADCAQYTPTKPAKFALEVEEGFLIKSGISNLWRLDMSWYKLPQATDLSQQEMDRLARRNVLQRQNLKSSVDVHSLGESGYESLRTLVALLATTIRPADIAATTPPSSDAKVSMALSTMMVNIVKANSNLKSAFIVRPTDAKDSFALIVDNFTYASQKMLDTDNNGVVSSLEQPMKPGTLLTYASLTTAIKTTFVSLADNGDVTVFAPVRNQNGDVIALVAVVQPAAAK